MICRPRTSLLIPSAVALALAVGVGVATSQPAPSTDPQAGAPLDPREAAGPWTLSSKGGAICTLSLKSTSDSRGVYVAEVPQPCRDAYAMTAVAGWRPTGDGMAFTSADGRSVVAFNRWSNSLLVSKRTSGADLQLMRGGPDGA